MISVLDILLHFLLCQDQSASFPHSQLATTNSCLVTSRLMLISLITAAVSSVSRAVSDVVTDGMELRLSEALTKHCLLHLEDNIL